MFERALALALARALVPGLVPMLPLELSSLEIAEGSALIAGTFKRLNEDHLPVE